MQKIKKHGFLISLEGIEGSGKSTQILRLKSYLEEKGYEVLTLREPGGTPTGEKIRSILLNLPDKTSPLTEALLFAASRSELLNNTILPFLNKEKTVVILDRYLDSSFAYQGYAGELGIDVIETIHSLYPLNILPDQTFYYRIDLKTSMTRQKDRGNKKDYFESKPDSYYQKLIDGFDKRAEIDSKRITTINGSLSPDEVHQLTIKALKL